MRVMVHGKHFTGTGKSALHFIGNHHDAVGITNLANRSHKFRRCYIKTTFALYWLKDNRGYLGGFDIGLEQSLNGFHRIISRSTVQLRRIRHMINGAREWPEADFIGSHFAG